MERVACIRLVGSTGAHVEKRRGVTVATFFAVVHPDVFIEVSIHPVVIIVINHSLNSKRLMPQAPTESSPRPIAVQFPSVVMKMNGYQRGKQSNPLWPAVPAP